MKTLVFLFISLCVIFSLAYAEPPTVPAAPAPTTVKVKKTPTKPGKKSRAAAPQIEFSLAVFEAKYKNAKSLEADFTQEVFQATLAKIKTSSGSIVLAKPNKIRWETYKPQPNLMVSNGRKLWFYTPAQSANDKGQVIEHNASRLQSQPLFRLLSGAAKLAEEFRISSQKSTAQGFEISLVPKKTQGDLERVSLELDSNYLISLINLENRSGNKTKISLQNLRLDSKFLSVLFDFSPPPGVERVQAE